MTDSTKVNDIQEKILESISILTQQSLREISFDKTISCTIEDNSDKKQGKYEVSDGTRVFTAYSENTSYKNGDVVYVMIPEGKFSNQKIIVGKKSSTEKNPLVVESPFDQLFDLTGNLLDEESQNKTYSLLANGTTKTAVIQDYDFTKDKYTNLIGYNRLGIRAEFRSLTSKAVSGNYGIVVAITFDKDGKRYTEEKAIQLDNSEMVGDSYNFETFYQQEEVVDISGKGSIVQMVVDFYQDRNFYDQYTAPLPCSNDGYKQDSEKLYIRDENGYLIPEGNALADNLFVQNIYICAGEDINKFSTDFVDLYSADSDKYNPDKAEEKTINMRWVHVGETNVDMVKAVEEQTLAKDIEYETRWYRYLIGTPAADSYCGAYWDRIDPANGKRIYYKDGKNLEDYTTAHQKLVQDCDKAIEEIRTKEGLTEEEKTTAQSQIIEERNEKIAELDKEYEAKSFWHYGDETAIEFDNKSFFCKFTPDGKKNSEKIKVIAFYNGVPYRCQKEMIFDNEKEVFDESAAVFVNALQIVEADGSNGNYLLYGQNAKLQEDDAGKKTRTLTAYFDANSDGVAESLIQPDENLVWIFPTENSMIKCLSETIKEYQQIAITEDDYATNKYYTTTDNINYTLATGDYSSSVVYYKQIDTGRIKNTSADPSYSIEQYYSSSKSNNTIYCEYTINGITYTTEKEMTFGPKGTMGTDQTIVIDFVGDANALVVGDGNSTYQLRVQLYDENNQLATPTENITWNWYYQTDASHLAITEGTNSSIVTITKGDIFSINDLNIIQCSVGDLTTYFALPIKVNGYNYITGPTQVIYRVDGKVDCSREPYQLFQTGLSPDWRIRVDNNGKIYQLRTEENIPYVYGAEGWSLATLTDKEKKAFGYVGNIIINSEGEYKLNPLSIYVDDALIYGVQACNGERVLWTQPILVLQNKWSSNVINKWDGKSLVLDEEKSNIIASSIAAGKKNSDDNTFSGVMLGDWSGTDSGKEVTEQTGIYGFDHGAMSYALTEDGKAFFGKDGNGRIYIDGNNATLQSGDWLNQKKGMKIDLDEPSIFMTQHADGENKRNTEFIQIDASKNGNISSASSNNAPFQIGKQFAVDWDGTLFANNGHFQGQITGDYGKIGNWTIETTDSEKAQTWKESSSSTTSVTLAGALHSGGTSPHIILNPNEDGSIIIGSSQYNRIVIDAKDSGTIKMGSESVLTGGTIKAGTLQSNSDSDRINLNGYLQVGNGTLGYVSSGVVGATSDTDGIGLTYNQVTAVKATGENAGLNYIKSNVANNSISVGPQVVAISVNNEKEGMSKIAGSLELHLASPSNKGTNNAQGYLYCNIMAEHQYGIYARFA